MMKSFTLILVSAFFISGTPESNVLSVVGNKPAVLKTSNGCWDVNHFVVNRGDSMLGEPATLGFISNNLQYFPADTLPSFHLLDFSFPDISSQSGLNGMGSEQRYFAVATENFIYLYSTSPSFFEDPEITLIDSMPTPPGFITLFVNDLTELLVINRQDSINCNYTFYDLPGLTIDAQFVINIQPEKIITGSFRNNPSCYLVAGNENENSKLLVIRTDNHQVVSIIALPAACRNTKELINTFSDYYFLSSPGDASTTITKMHLADTSTSVFPVLSSGVHASSTYGFDDFIIQPIDDTSQNELHRQLLVIDGATGAISTVVPLNKRVLSMHSNSSIGWGPYVYSLIFGVNNPSAEDSVYFYGTSGFNMLDSLQAGANPTWFAEDFRCYISIEEIEKNLAIKVYPNPADEQVNIQITGLAKGKAYNFDISDESGNISWKQEIFSKQEYSIPLQQFPKGLLLLRVNAGTKTVTKKILKL